MENAPHKVKTDIHASFAINCSANLMSFLTFGCFNQKTFGNVTTATNFKSLQEETTLYNNDVDEPTSAYFKNYTIERKKMPAKAMPQKTISINKTLSNGVRKLKRYFFTKHTRGGIPNDSEEIRKTRNDMFGKNFEESVVSFVQPYCNGEFGGNVKNYKNNFSEWNNVLKLSEAVEESSKIPKLDNEKSPTKFSSENCSQGTSNGDSHYFDDYKKFIKMTDTAACGIENKNDRTFTPKRKQVDVGGFDLKRLKQHEAKTFTSEEKEDVFSAENLLADAELLILGDLLPSLSTDYNLGSGEVFDVDGFVDFSSLANSLDQPPFCGKEVDREFYVSLAQEFGSDFNQMYDGYLNCLSKENIINRSDSLLSVLSSHFSRPDHIKGLEENRTYNICYGEKCMNLLVILYMNISGLEDPSINGNQSQYVPIAHLEEMEEINSSKNEQQNANNDQNHRCRQSKMTSRVLFSSAVLEATLLMYYKAIAPNSPFEQRQPRNWKYVLQRINVFSSVVDNCIKKYHDIVDEYAPVIKGSVWEFGEGFTPLFGLARCKPWSPLSLWATALTARQIEEKQNVFRK